MTWSRHEDSNPGHPLYKSGALPTELCRRIFLNKNIMDSKCPWGHFLKKTKKLIMDSKCPWGHFLKKTKKLIMDSKCPWGHFLKNTKKLIMDSKCPWGHFEFNFQICLNLLYLFFDYSNHFLS